MFQRDGPTFRELMAQALSSTERGYDMIAPKFDLTPFRTPEPVLAEMAKIIGKIGSALDVCCGTGAAMRHLAPLCSERVVGIDFSSGMLDEAARRLRGVDSSAKIFFDRGDVLEMKYDREFDVVTCVGAFGHILERDEPTFLARVRVALRPGGRFVFATSPKPQPHHAWFWMAHGFNAVMRVRNALVRPPFIMYYLTFTWPEVRAKLERAGFTVTAHERCVAAPFERVVIVVAR